MEELKKILQKVKEQVDYENEKFLLTDGIIDSVELVELVAEIEEKYGIEIPLEDITPENFDSVSDIHNMITRLQQ